MERSSSAESAGETCPEGDDSISVEVLPLTEAHQNVQSELESFRQRWKEELAKNNDGSGSRGREAVTSFSPDRRFKFGPSDSSAVYSAQQKLPKILEHSSANAESVPSVAQPHSAGHLDKENISDDAIRLKRISEDEKEQKARSLYVHGVELERAGKLYEAIQQYRRAMQLVPHIESIAVAHASDEADSTESRSNNSDDDGEPEEQEEDLVIRGPILTHITALLSPNAPVCEKKYPQEGVHLSSLPREIMEQILYWVVGADLDMRSLHAVAAVCRGFFVLSRSEALWKRACQRVWGFDCSPFSAPPEPWQLTTSCHQGHQLSEYSWRHMYLTRPKPRYNGCYISKISYFRSGECNFHDQNYQPWHLVIYYRFFRFFPGDVVLMITTCDQPQAVVGHLAHKDPKHSQVLAGRYTLEGSLVHLSFRRCSNTKRQLQRTRRRRGQGTTDVAETTFDMTLELANARRGCRNWFLQWREYTISSLDCTGAVHSAQVDVTQLDSFPQLAFSRVKSYTRESSEPLM